MKLSGSRNKRDGFIHNIVDDSYGDTVDTWTWRGQLRIDATPNLQFLISGDGLIGRENGSLGNVLTNSTGTTIDRSEEHTSELQSLMRISYAVFCLKKKKITTDQHTNNST